MDLPYKNLQRTHITLLVLHKKISFEVSDEIFSSQVLDSHGYLLTALGHGLWPSMVLLSEIVQTFILADFCYYYVKRCVLWINSNNMVLVYS